MEQTPVTRRAVERNTLRDVSAQFDLLAEREREALVPFARLRSLQEFLDRQDERVVQVPLDGSSPSRNLRIGSSLSGQSWDRSVPTLGRDLLFHAGVGLLATEPGDTTAGPGLRAPWGSGACDKR